MATTPYFVLSPNLILSTIGLIHGPDKTIPTPAEDWREATVGVIIPSLNEEKNIIFCLDALFKQTVKPIKIILVDDGSSDKTVQFAREFCKLHEIDILIIERDHPIGKTPTLKRQSREFDYDVEFILDADTILESENYIERTVEELYKAVGISSVCGMVLPVRDKDRISWYDNERIKQYFDVYGEKDFLLKQDFFHRHMRKISSIYRDVLYSFLEKFVYHGQMVFFGSITNPVGCAVAYRRKYLKDLFDTYEPILGDDLTTSEDIFIGFAMLNHGYRNVQIIDVSARSQEPEYENLPRQIYLWSSSFFQSCYYFPDLVFTPLKSFRSYLHHKKMQKKEAEIIKQKRKIQEPYRQPFGDEYTKKYGRPMGWAIFTSLIEKVFFPLILLLMILFQWWEPLIITLIAEATISIGILVYINKGQRWKYFWKGIIATPFRYISLMTDLFVFVKFLIDVYILKDRRWRK